MYAPTRNPNAGNLAVILRIREVLRLGRDYLSEDLARDGRGCEESFGHIAGGVDGPCFSLGGYRLIEGHEGNNERGATDRD